MEHTMTETLDQAITQLRARIQAARNAQARIVEDFTAELADTAGVAVSTIARLLYVPKTNLTVKTLRKIDQALREMEGVDGNG